MPVVGEKSVASVRNRRASSLRHDAKLSTTIHVGLEAALHTKLATTSSCRIRWTGPR